MHDTAHAIAPGITYLFAFILALMVGALALEEKIHAKKSVITGVTAVVSLFLGDALGIFNLSHGGGHMPFYIPFIDWEVILIILGSSLFVDIVSKSGIFSWTAIKLTKISKGDPVLLLVYYSVLTVLFSAFLNNVTAMIIIGSLTAVSLSKLNQQEKLLGFLLTEGLLTNIGGLLTLISSVPNIIVGQKAGISFMAFFYMAAPYVLVTTAATIFMGKLIFKIERLKTDDEKAAAEALVNSFDETDGIESQGFFVFSWIAFTLLILLFATNSVLPVFKDLGLGFLAMAFGILMLVKYKHEVDKNYKSLDWDLLFFFGTLFCVIGVMEHAGVLKMIGGVIAGLIGLGETGGPMALLWGSAFMSSVTDNIPLAAMLANILGGIKDLDPSLWWCVIFGANLGGNITPIGSASTVVAVTIIHKNKIKLTFGQFVKTAVPFAIMQLILASAYILIVF